MGRPRIAVIALAVVAAAFGSVTESTAQAPSAPRTTPVTLDGDPRFALSPPRFAPIDAAPGSRHRVALVARNLTNAPIRFRTTTLPLRGSPDPTSLATPASDARSKVAQDWVTFPLGDTYALPPATQVEIPIQIDVPDGAPPGTHALALVASQRIGIPSPGGVEGNDARVLVDADVSSQLVLRVPGDVTSDARLRVLEAPRLVWNGNATEFVARVENRGDTDLMVDGQVELDAFFGTAGRTLDATGPEKGQLALPDGVRDVRIRWSDPPLLGWFRPELVVVGGKGSGVRITKELPTVFVLPPWWMIVLLLLAVALPIHAGRRRRRDPDSQRARTSRAKRRVEQRMARDRARQRAEDARRGRR